MFKALIIAILLCLTSLAVQAQEKKPSPTPKPGQTPSVLDQDDIVRISTELVQTDVMVFDKDGRFVSDLKPELFKLLVDGKPQPIAFFEAVVTGGKNEAASLKAGRGNKDLKPAEPASPGEVSERGRTILFFVNDLH